MMAFVGHFLHFSYSDMLRMELRELEFFTKEAYELAKAKSSSFE